MRASGRRARWSMKYSVSKVAKTSVLMVLSRVEIAVLAPVRRQSTLRGSPRDGLAQLGVGEIDNPVVDLLVHLVLLQSIQSSLGEHCDMSREFGDAALIARGGPGAVAREHPLQDTSQFPVAERLIVRDVTDIERRVRRVRFEDLAATGEARRGRWCSTQECGGGVTSLTQ